MSCEPYPPVHLQRGHYNSPEHESLRASARSVLVNFGTAEKERIDRMIGALGFSGGSQMDPKTASLVRKLVDAVWFSEVGR